MLPLFDTSSISRGWSLPDDEASIVPLCVERISRESGEYEPEMLPFEVRSFVDVVLRN